MKVAASYIANRIFSTSSKNKKSAIVKTSVLAITLGVCAITLTLCVVSGFQSEIRNKVISFGNHVTISKLNNNNKITPILIDTALEESILVNDNVVDVRPFITKPALLKVKKELQGVIVKGLSDDLDFSKIELKITAISDEFIQKKTFGKGIIISEKLAKKIDATLNQKVILYFVGGNRNLSPKDFIVKGLYKTGFSRFDETFVITNFSYLQKTNKWSKNQIQGYEILVDDFNHIEEVADKVYTQTAYDLQVTSIFEEYPQLFSWVDFQNINMIIILSLMIIIAVINAISAFLILVLEKITLTGVLKSLGASNRMVANIFIRGAFKTIMKGLLYGNIIGLLIAALQYFTHFIKLEESTYYLAYVPIKFPFTSILIVNFATLIICLLALLIPSKIITKIKPYKVLKIN